MNKDIVLKWFERYPKLETFIGAGTISLKMARDTGSGQVFHVRDVFRACNCRSSYFKW